MTSRLKLKRKKFEEPYKDDSNQLDDDGNKGMDYAGKEIKRMKNQRIFERGIENAKKHKIKLKPGTQNDGHGNCSYESVILNIRDRECFKDKLPMSPSFYRRIWNIDLMNKILDKKIPWNPGLTSAEIREGFKELMDSGVYERSFFGDMMMAGIACGARKIILIFNTHEMTSHDPISVIDPTHYGGSYDTEIPVVLAYDLVHYESLEPIEGNDIIETVKLTKSYTAQPSRYRHEYGFTRQDMLYLISPSIKLQEKKEDDMEKSQKKSCVLGMVQETDLTNTSLNKQSMNLRGFSTQNPSCGRMNNRETGFKFECWYFKELMNGKIRCAICKGEFTRLLTHLSPTSNCSQNLQDMEKFKMEFTLYMTAQKKMSRKVDERAEDIEISDKGRKSNFVNDGQNNAEDVDTKAKATKDSKSENNPREYFEFGDVKFEELEDGMVRCGICKIASSRLVSHLNNNEKCKKEFCMSEFRKEYSNYRHRIRMKKHGIKQKLEDTEKFRKNAAERKRKQVEKQKIEDEEKFKRNGNERKRKYDQKQKAEDEKKFRKNVAERKRKQEEKQKAEDE